MYFFLLQSLLTQNCYTCHPWHAANAEFLRRILWEEHVVDLVLQTDAIRIRKVWA